MATPLPLEVPTRDVREELQVRLERAPGEHAEAVLAGYEVLQALHGAGVFELLRGTLGSGDKVLQIAVDAAASTDATRGIRNLLILAKILGSINPELLEKLAGAVPDALEGVAAGEAGKPPGMWEMLKIFRSPDLRRGIVIVNNLLEAWGKNFTPKGPQAV